ncbi:MAG: hypothetical protein K8R58_04820 [Bacteroidales bacterium]|nr:hypothetical protein [Bacteroidales bacterium]
MDQKKSLKKRRLGVVLNYIGLILLMITYEYAETTAWDTLLVSLEIIAILIILISFSFTYWKTSLWQFIHKPFKELDERELQLTGNSLRYAYAIFTTIALTIFLLYSLFERNFNIVLTVSLIYFAHILPASILAWIEKEV